MSRDHREQQEIEKRYFCDENREWNDRLGAANAWGLTDQATELLEELPEPVSDAIRELVAYLPRAGREIDYEIRGPYEGRRKIVSDLLYIFEKDFTWSDELHSALHAILLMNLLSEESISALMRFYPKMKRKT